jgi:hypothetical protein
MAMGTLLSKGQHSFEPNPLFVSLRLTCIVDDFTVCILDFGTKGVTEAKFDVMSLRVIAVIDVPRRWVTLRTQFPGVLKPGPAIKTLDFMPPLRS